MAFGVLQGSKSYRQLWRRSATRSPVLGRGAASLVLGSDAIDEVVTMRTGDRIEVQASGSVNDTLYLAVRGSVRLNAQLPVGYGWRVSVTVDSYTREFDLMQSVYADSHTPFELLLDDTNINVTGLGAIDVSFALELVLDPANGFGSALTDLDVTLPSVYFDQLYVPQTVTTALYIESRAPAPGQVSVPTDFDTITFTLADTNGAGVDLTNTEVTVDGVVAYTAGAFVLPWAGSTTTGTGPTGDDVDFSLSVPAANLPYASEQVVEVQVTSQLLGPLSPIDETWTFIVADVLQPAMQTAAMQDKRLLRVVFTDDLRMDTTATGALNPDNYAVTRISVPAASMSVVSVEAVAGRTDAVDLVLNVDASWGAEYALLAKDLTDINGNVVSPSGSTIGFTGYTPYQPPGRRFDLLDFISDENLRADRESTNGEYESEPGTGDLHRFIAVLQDVVNVMLCSIDEWTRILDIDLAPEQFLNAILQDLGNPFQACISDLSVTDKRRLARILISIYKQKGTEQGVINAIRFFLGVEMTLDILNYREYWQLGISQLDLSTILAPPVGSSLWYSFYVVSPIVLTDEQRQRTLCIAEYMRGANEHVLGILEPGDVVTSSNYWVLSQSLLGANPATDPSTILS